MADTEPKHNHKQFSEFLLREYDNIASAYFNTKKSISIFFRYYILITSVPITFLLLVYRQNQVDVPLLQIATSDMIALVCFLIAIVGFTLMMYVLSMSYTATLYARQVNGIRHFFYEISGLDDSLIEKTLVLPTNNLKPVYSSARSIKYLLLAFTIVNAFYFTLGWYIAHKLTAAEFVGYWIAATFLQWIICFIRTSIKQSNS